MDTKALTRTEIELLRLIRQEHEKRAGRGRSARLGLTRDEISVEGRGRGLEVAEPLRTLTAAGLLEIDERSPGFFARLFGARAGTFYRPTTAGIEFDADAALAAGAAVAPGVASQGFANYTPPTQPIQPRELPPRSFPKVQDGPGYIEPSAPAAPAAAAEGANAPQETAPVELAAVTLDPADMVGPEVIDPEEMEGIYLVLEGMGMQLTPEGERLIATLIAKGGLSAGEAVTRTVLFTFAHEVSRRGGGGADEDAAALKSYAIEVMREMEKLRDAGQIREPIFEQDMRALWDLVDPAGPQARIAGTILTDRLGGLAVPAHLPEDLQPVEA